MPDSEGWNLPLPYFISRYSRYHREAEIYQHCVTKYSPTIAPLSATVTAPSVMTGAVPNGCTSDNDLGANPEGSRV